MAKETLPLTFFFQNTPKNERFIYFLVYTRYIQKKEATKMNEEELQKIFEEEWQKLAMEDEKNGI